MQPTRANCRFITDFISESRRHSSMNPITLFLLLTTQVIASNLDRANSLYTSGNMKEAISLYRKALTEGENPALCYFNMANAYFQIDSIPQSITFYKAALSYAPDFHRGYLNLSIAYFSLDDPGACIAAVKRALEYEPSDQKALLILAASYRKVKAFPEAIATFRQILSLNPEHEDSYIAIAEMYRELDDPEEAIMWLCRYPESGKNQEFVFLMLSDLYEQQNRIDKALFSARKAFGEKPQNRWTLYRICLLLEKQGNYLVALEEAQAGMGLFPEFSELALIAGNLSFKLDKLAKAEHYYTLARQLGNAGAVTGLENIRVVRRRASLEM